jgi:Ca-activated chloride channel family protein
MTLSVSRHRRSHRAWWVATVVGVALVVAAGTAVVVLRGSPGGCDEPPVTLDIAASPDQAPVLSQLADSWNAGDPVVGQRCAEVAVTAMPSAAAATALSATWDESQAGPAPDVWLPDSSMWLSVAAARPDVAGMLPADPPSLASSPVVLGMQRPMAEALGWPDQQLGWSELLGAFGGGQTWEQFGHPEWGPLELGLADPTRTTAGLAGVVTALDLDGDSQLSDQELLGAVVFAQLVTTQAEDTGELLGAYASEPAPDLPAAFPVLEHDLARHAAGEPELPLVPVYLREGVVYADYPYTVLAAPWVDEPVQQLADQFLAHLRTPTARQAYAEAGFRDADRAAGDVPLLAPEAGFAAEVGPPAREPTPEGLSELLGRWSVLVRPTNLLLVLDTSGSMSDLVPGTEQTRLQLLQSAAIQGIPLLNNQITVGLWEFSTELTPTTPYRELVPVGLAGEPVGEVDRRQAMVGAIQGMTAQGGTGLYDTVHDAYLQMQEVWQPEAQNLLVVITDGRDEDHPGRTLPELLSELEETVQPDRPLAIIAMAVGPEADAEALQQITDVTGGRTFLARDETTALQQVVLAFSGRIS